MPFVTDPQVLRLVAQVAPTTSPETGKKESRRHDAIPTLPAPYFTSGRAASVLYQGDALELLRALPSQRFDLVFADPPYFLSGGGMTCKNGRAASVNKGVWDTPLTLAEMHAFNRAWLAECARVLKTDGSLWVSGTAHNIYSVGWALQTLGYKILNDIAWYKVNPPPNLSCRYFTHATETLLWAKPDPTARHTFQYQDMKADNDGKQMQSLWRIKPPAPWEKRHGKHPTQKPEALLSRIVRASTNAGALVLDPFCGSGTTGVVCARLGRGFVGIDQEAAYLDLAVHRITDEEADALPSDATLSLRLADITVVRVLSARPRWEDMVSDALRTLGGEAHLNQINESIVQRWGKELTPTWVCTVRRVVRQSPRIVPVSRGTYKLQEHLTLGL